MLLVVGCKCKICDDETAWRENIKRFKQKSLTEYLPFALLPALHTPQASEPYASADSPSEFDPIILWKGLWPSSKRQSLIVDVWFSVGWGRVVAVMKGIQKGKVRGREGEGEGGGGQREGWRKEVGERKKEEGKEEGEGKGRGGGGEDEWEGEREGWGGGGGTVPRILFIRQGFTFEFTSWAASLGRNELAQI